jgi:hypothetical protein
MILLLRKGVLEDGLTLTILRIHIPGDETGRLSGDPIGTGMKMTTSTGTVLGESGVMNGTGTKTGDT